VNVALYPPTGQYIKALGVQYSRSMRQRAYLCAAMRVRAYFSDTYRVACCSLRCLRCVFIQVGNKSSCDVNLDRSSLVELGLVGGRGGILGDRDSGRSS